MRYIFLSFLVPFWLQTLSISAFARQYNPQSKMVQNPSYSHVDTFYTTTGFVQEQINLITRIERALEIKNPNRVCAVRGQILVQALSIEGFVKRQYPNYKTVCTSLVATKELRILCPLYASSQELQHFSCN